MSIEYITDPHKVERHYAKIKQSDKVERAGWLTASKKLASIQESGRKLSEFRKGEFAYDDTNPENRLCDDNTGFDENFHDPTRDPGFDDADATQIILEQELKNGQNVKSDQVDNSTSGNSGSDLQDSEKPKVEE